VEDLLRALDPHSLSLKSYPNYHDISLGACIATPVHGHSSSTALMASQVLSFTYIDRLNPSGKQLMAAKGSASFKSCCFNLGDRYVVTSVTVKPCKKRFWKKKIVYLPFIEVKAEDIKKELQSSDTCEVRMHLPILNRLPLGLSAVLTPLLIRTPLLKTLMFQVITWSEADEKDCIERKQGKPVRGVVNWKNIVLMEVGLMRFMFNTEWYLSASSFGRFWSHYQQHFWEYGFYKLLIRRMEPDGLDHSPASVEDRYCVDVCCFNWAQEYLRETMSAYSSKQHTGKFIVGSTSARMAASGLTKAACEEQSAFEG